MSETQRELWDWESLPEREDLVVMVQARSFLAQKSAGLLPENGGVTGERVIRRLSRDEETLEEICTLLVTGAATKFVARKYGISPRSVKRIKEAMEDRGELAPIRLRIQRRLDEMVELGLEAITSGILSGEIHPGQLPIAIMAGIDKREQLSVGIVPGTDRTRKEISADDLRAEFEAMRQSKVVEVPPTDSQSVVSDPKSLTDNGPTDLANCLASFGSVSDRIPEPTDRKVGPGSAAEAAATPPPLRGVDGAGGGSASPTGGGLQPYGIWRIDLDPKDLWN